MYLTKAIPPSKINTKLKEMQMSYDLFQAQHRQEATHTVWCLVVVSLRSFKAVASTGQFRDKKRGPWQFVLQLQLVLWECLTSFPGISAFLVQNPEAKGSAAPLAQGWFLLALVHQGLAPTEERQSPLFFHRLLLKSHQVCRNLLFVTLAGSTQMLKPQHCIHPIASLKLV